MPHRAHSSSFPSFKLANVRHTHLSRSPRNEWLASDRAEKMAQIVTVALVVAVFAVGVVLMVWGLMR